MSSCLLCSCHNLQGSWGLQAASFTIVTAMAEDHRRLAQVKSPHSQFWRLNVQNQGVCRAVLEEKGPFLPLLLPKAPDSPWLERHPEVSPWSSPAVSSLRVSLGPKRPLF